MHEGAHVLPFRGIWPRIAPDVFVAPGASIIGDVEIGEGAGIWFGCILRGDVERIRVGARTNIQDGTVVHIARKQGPTSIGAEVTIGHMALIHACVLEDGCFVGMGATVLDHAVVETGAMVAAGAMVTPGKRVPKGELWAGRPARFMRALGPEDEALLRDTVTNYARLAAEYRAGARSTSR